MVISESPAVEVGDLPLNGKRRGSVLITGRGTEIAFNLDEDAPIEQLARELDSHLAGQNALFSKGGISINTGARTLTSDEEEEIRRIFREKSGLQIARFASSSEQNADEPAPTIENLPVRRLRKDSEPLPQFSSADLARALSGLSSQGQRQRDGAMVVRGTVRSGELVQHPGDLVVLGDANPGSEIRADGDIIVIGALKGLAHAGASGDDKAAIIASAISSPRISIGSRESVSTARSNGFSAIGPAGESGPGQPVIAYVRRDSIYVSAFTSRSARYTKGVPYEG